MPDRSGPLDIKLAGLPFKIMQTPGARPGEPAKAEYVCKEVAQITDHFGGGTEPNYGDYPTSVESVYFQDDWSNGISPTRLQKIDKTYWNALNVDARRPGQLILGPFVNGVTAVGTATDDQVIKILDFGTATFAAITNRLLRLATGTGNNFVVVKTYTAPATITDVAGFNGNLIMGAKSTTSDSGSGGTVTYGATTLTDTSKNWTVNAWTGRLVFAGGQTSYVVSNTATVLTVLAWTSTPANGSAYSIDTYFAYNYSPDGVTWSTFDPRGGGTDAGRIDKLTAVRFQFWKSVLPNKVYSCLDPTVVATSASSWTSTASLIGDSGKNITSLSAYTTDLAIGKEDGVWSLDRNGNDFPILPELASVSAPTNVVNMRQWRNGLNFPVRTGFFRYEGSKLESIGLDRYKAGGTFFSPNTLSVIDSAPYINELLVALTGGGPAINQRSLIAALLPDPWRWHVFVADQSQWAPTATAISTNASGSLGAGASIPFFFFGQKRATFAPLVSYFRLPSNTDNPLDDLNYAYAATGQLTTTEIAPLPDQEKVFTLVRIRAQANDDFLTSTVALEYSVDADIESPVWTGMIGPQGQTAQIVARSSQQGPFSVLEYFFPNPTVGKTIQFRLTLTRGSGQTSTPIVRHLVVHYKHMPQARKRWELGLICEDGSLGDSGYRDSRSAATQVAQLVQLRQPPRTPKTFEDRMGKEWSVFVERVDHELIEKLPQSDRWLVKVTLLENLGTAAPLVAPLEAL